MTRLDTYFGTHPVQACRMTRREFLARTGQQMPGAAEETEAGYLVEYASGSQTAAGVWLPEAFFRLNFRKNGQLDFSRALLALRTQDARIARRGWNGKEMWLALSCDGSRSVPAQDFWSRHNAAHALAQGGAATVLPSITMKTADGSIVMGWLASQTDLLAEDWEVLEWD